MKLSVVVGTWNRCTQLRACVESIFDQTTTSVRVYVTDAGSTDGTVEYLRAIASGRLIPLFLGRRVGQARAYNDVFAEIETPYVCWLSDDNVVVNKGLDVGVSILDENERIGMVALKVKDVTGPFVDAPYIGGMSAIGILNVNQGMLRTSIMKEVGDFSEVFQDYGIDPDLTAKVLFSGHSVAYTRQIAIHHYRNWSADRSSKDYAKQMEKQKAYLELYLQKYGALATGGMGWTVKKFAWRLLQGWFEPVNSTRPPLGLIARDWENIFTSRYIRLMDPLLCRGKPYHLVQYCRRPQRPTTLPPDPEKSTHLRRPTKTSMSAKRPSLEQRIRARIPASVKRWIKERPLPPKPQVDAGALIKAYIDGGRIPWSPGYKEYKLQYIARVLGDEFFLQAFRDGHNLPSGYGYRLDERAVEYPWAFSCTGDWGQKILDAGSTLNNPVLLEHPALKKREVIIYDLARGWMAKRGNVSYITGDLRDAILRDGVIDVVVCISTLEHVGLDNTFLYTSDQRYRENRPSDYKAVLREFRRILKSQGRLLVTVPFGTAGSLRWLQQFNQKGVEEIISEFGGSVLDVSYFKYEPTGWVRSTAAACAECKYFDIHAKGQFDPDYAAAARAVACIEFLRSS